MNMLKSAQLLGVLERIRSVEGDIEDSIESIVRQQMLTVSNRRHQILIDHFVKAKLSSIRASSEKLLDMYLDEDDIVEARRLPAAAAAVPAEGDDGDDGRFLAQVMQTFEAQVSSLREYHSRNSDIPPQRIQVEVPDASLTAATFTTDERHGECFDLANVYRLYSTFMVETKKIDDSLEKRLEYLTFVSNLARVILETPLERKLLCLDLYRDFVNGLSQYLRDFHHRIKPLNSEALQEVLEKVATQNIEYFALVSAQATAVHLKKFAKLFAPYDVSVLESRSPAISMSCAQELSRLEGEVLKMISSVLSDEMIATGKTLQRSQCKSAEELRTERKQEDELFHESLAAANAKSGVATFTDVVAQEHLNQNKDLHPVLAAGSSSAGEATPAETSASHAAALVESIRYGVDGKPIPQWIVTMQQLDKKFPCEVCGGTVYDGPKNFSEHFRAERHIGALARLGVVQNLRLFDHVDKIREVLQLRDRLEGHAVGSSRRRMREDELSEEMQDVQGNVMTNRHFRQYQDRRNTL